MMHKLIKQEIEDHYELEWLPDTHEITNTLLNSEWNYNNADVRNEQVYTYGELYDVVIEVKRELEKSVKRAYVREKLKQEEFDNKKMEME